MPISLIITPLLVDLLVGEQVQLTVLPSPNGVKWSCSACNVASVTKQGLVTGLSEGTAIITGKRGNVSVSVSVTVTDVDPPDPPGPPAPPTLRLVATEGSTNEDVWVFSTAGTVPAAGDVIVQSTLNFGDGTGTTTYPGAPPEEPTHPFLIPGVYTVRMTVLTALGATGDIELPVTVLAVPSPPDPEPPPPLQSPVVSLTFVSGLYTNQPVTLAASTVDPDGTIAQHTVNYGDGTEVTRTGPVLPTLLHNYVTAGSYDVSLTAVDNDGQLGSATLRVTVVAQPTVNQPPVPVLDKVAGVFVGDLFTFSTVGSFDPDGTLVSGQFQPGNGQVQSWSGPPPPSLPATYTVAGTATARLTVTDNSGESRTALLSVTVSALPAPGDYPYYNTMIGRPDCIAKFSLRTQAQLQKNGVSSAPYVVYDPVVDAAKINIPPFLSNAQGTLDSNIDATTQTIPITFTPAISLQHERPFKIDNEVVVADRIAPGVFQFLRGQYGTTAASHTAGALVYKGVSSLPSQVREVVNLTPGSTYFLGWEIYHTAPLQEKHWKAWQHSLQSTHIWYEIGNSKPDLGDKLGGRAYGIAGPNMTENNSMKPVSGSFEIVNDRWTRIWSFIDMRPAIPMMSLWGGDAVQGIVQCFSLLQQNYLTGAAPIDQWWIEYNTSLNSIDSQLRTLVGWNRNLFVLRGLEESAVPLSISGLTP